MTPTLGTFPKNHLFCYRPPSLMKREILRCFRILCVFVFQLNAEYRAQPLCSGGVHALTTKMQNCTLQNFALDVLFNIEPEQKTDLIYLVLSCTLSPRKQKILLQDFVIKREPRKWWQKVHCICKSTSLKGILDNSAIAIVQLILCRQLEWSYQRTDLQMILV